MVGNGKFRKGGDCRFARSLNKQLRSLRERPPHRKATHLVLRLIAEQTPGLPFGLTPEREVVPEYRRKVWFFFFLQSVFDSGLRSVMMIVE